MVISRSTKPLRIWFNFRMKVLEYGSYSFKSDVWSFGIVLWELFSFGKVPYPGMSNAEAAENVLKGYRMPCPENCPNEIYVLMEQCWLSDPIDRPYFKASSQLMKLSYIYCRIFS